MISAKKRQKRSGLPPIRCFRGSSPYLAVNLKIVGSPCRSFHLVLEFSFQTNAPPVGGYVSSNMMRITAGQDAVTLQTLGWTDNVEDLPMAYEFGYAQGWHEVLSVSR